MDFYELMTKVIANGELVKARTGKKAIFNMDRLMKKSFPEKRNFKEVETDYVNEALRQFNAEIDAKKIKVSAEELQKMAQQAASEEIAGRIVQMARGFVPRALTEKNQVEASESEELHAVEMARRREVMNDITFRHFGHKIAVRFKPLGGLKGSDTEFDVSLAETDRAVDAHGVEVYNLPARARRAWTIHMIKAVYLRSMKFLKSPEFLVGAKDIADPAKVRAMIERGELVPFSSAEGAKFVNLQPSWFDRLRDKFYDRFYGDRKLIKAYSDNHSALTGDLAAPSCQAFFAD
jgi:hypothetical protein